MLDFILFALFSITFIRLLNLISLFKQSSVVDKSETLQKLQEFLNPFNRFLLNSIFFIQGLSLILYPSIYGITFWISYESFFKVLKLLLSNV